MSHGVANLGQARAYVKSNDWLVGSCVGWIVLAGWMLLSVGCASQSSSGEVSAPAVASPSAAEGSPCPPALPTSEVKDKYSRGAAELSACDEGCMKSVDGSKRRGEALALLLEAARGGDLRAQSLYGRTVFGDLMTTGVTEDMRADYEDAIAWLLVAARREDNEVRAFIHGLDGVTLDENAEFLAPLPAPLDELDETWVRAATQKADSIRGCWP